MRKREGASLVLVLWVIVLLTVLVVSFSVIVLNEDQSARLTAGSQQAEFLAQMALDTAMEGITAALAPFDDPFGPDPAPAFFWSLAPGRIDHYAREAGSARPVVARVFDLHSGAPFGLSDDEKVDLNEAGANGVRPIDNALPGGRKMEVAWVEVLEDPGQPAGAANRMIGRYAFWVDDEGAKVNINTADGGHKYDWAMSHGPGTPSEVNLGALIDPATSGALPAAGVESAANRAREGGFSSPSEILQIPGIPTSFYTGNNFNLTAYSRSPEFNLFNEPRLQLAPTNLQTLGGAALGNVNSIFGWLLGAWTRPGNLLARTPVRSAYPSPNQLTHGLQTLWPILPSLNTDNNNFHNTQRSTLIKASRMGTPDAAGWAAYSKPYAGVAEQVARYLAGTNGRGEAVEWPFSEASYLGKYNLRQIDSIAVQILDMAKMSVPFGGSRAPANTDGRSLPTMALFGLLQDEPVSGIGRAPRLTEIYGEFTMTQTLDSGGNPKSGFLKGLLQVELFYPAGPFHPPPAFEYGFPNPSTQARFGHMEVPPDAAGPPHMMNSEDAPRVLISNSLIPNVGPDHASEIDGKSYWMDNLFVARDQTGGPAGIDFWGNAPDRPDPDQAKAQQFREPEPEDPDPDVPYIPYPGFGWTKGRATPLFKMGSIGLAPVEGPYVNFSQPVPLGIYTVTRNDLYPLASRPGFKLRDPVHGMPPVTSVTLSGHLSLLIRFFESYNRGTFDFTPMGILRGPARASPTVATRPNFSGAGDVYDPNGGLPIPEITVSPGQPARMHFRVRDPFVNKNVGDWITATTDADRTMPVTYPLSAGQVTARHTTHNVGADDMAACWIGRNPYSPDAAPDWPNWSTQASLPSVGVLHYIRTKMMPDTGTQAGVPFRCLSFAAPADPSQSQIPDWAMLDLFTVPAGMWKTPASASTSATGAAPDFAFGSFFGGDYIPFTYGGATSGRINVNGCVLYPWAGAAGPADRLPPRLAPLRAVFQGLKYNRDGVLTFDGDGNRTSSPEGPVSAEQAEAISSAIAAQIGAHGPLALPGAICDVPELTAGYGATVNPTRNDVVAQAIGNLTTQGNVFSVWVVAQSVQKLPANQEHGRFENGDRVLAQRRMRFIVERFLDLGIDHVPGNTVKPGADGIVGTFDDPVDPLYHPANPRFRYRVIHVGEIR